LEGDAGWARVQQVEPGQEVLIDVAPPVDHRPGMSMRPWRADRPPSGAPPYEVPMRVTTDLVSVDDRAIVVNADAPMTIERSKVMGLSVRTPGETKTREGAFRGIVWGGIVGTLVGLAVRAAAGTAAGIATGGALLGYVTYANWAAPRPGTTPFQRIYRMSPPLR